jgi:hypothetical protein
MTAKEIKKYIRYIADWRLSQLGLPAIYMVEEHPLPLADPAAQRRGARQLLRNPRHRVFQGRDAGKLERRVVELRQPPGAPGESMARTTRPRATGRGCLGMSG